MNEYLQKQCLKTGTHPVILYHEGPQNRDVPGRRRGFHAHRAVQHQALFPILMFRFTLRAVGFLLPVRDGTLLEKHPPTGNHCCLTCTEFTICEFIVPGACFSRGVLFGGKFSPTDRPGLVAAFI